MREQISGLLPPPPLPFSAHQLSGSSSSYLPTRLPSLSAPKVTNPFPLQLK